MTSSEKMADRFLQWLHFFQFRSVYKTLDKVKEKGFNPSDLLKVLVLLPFTGRSTIASFLDSRYFGLSIASKDSYYRLKRSQEIDWEDCHFGFVKRFVKIVEKNKSSSESSSVEQPTCLAVDDSVLQKVGKTIEGVGKLWDHVNQRYVLGYRLLLLGYFDGKSFLPVNFTLHREKGKKANKPYGLTKEEYNAQFGQNRGAESITGRRKAAMDVDKISTAVHMIRKACRSLRVEYLLMDSWFTCEKMLLLAKELKVNLIGMMKMGNAKYVYKGEEYSAKALLSRLESQRKRCRKLNAHYILVDVIYKGHPVRLYFSRFGKQASWQLILSTDLNIGYVKTMEIYQIRWSIEVFFKEAKQLLNLGKCQAEDLAAQFCDITVVMIQYILLTLRKRFGAYETKGALFREAEEKLVTLTLDQRLWGLFLEIVKFIVAVLKLQIQDIDLFIQDLVNNKELKKYSFLSEHLKPINY